MVTSLTVPWSTSDMKREKLISWTFWPEFAVLTTCHKATAEIRITTQKMIVFTVEFTEKAPEKGRLAFHPKPQTIANWGPRWGNPAELHLSQEIRCWSRNLDRQNAAAAVLPRSAKKCGRMFV